MPTKVATRVFFETAVFGLYDATPPMSLTLTRVHRCRCVLHPTVIFHLAVFLVGGPGVQGFSPDCQSATV